MAWFGFWIFLTVFVLCEAYLYTKGHDTNIWYYKTDAEKRIQKSVTSDSKEGK